MKNSSYYLASFLPDFNPNSPAVTPLISRLMEIERLMKGLETEKAQIISDLDARIASEYSAKEIEAADRLSRKVCYLREDLILNSDYLINIGDKSYTITALKILTDNTLKFLYRNSDDQFQVWFMGRWCDASSLDFAFNLGL